MYCKICGKVIPDGTDYCGNCAEEIPSVTMGEALKLYFANYANFKGRARRSEYWKAGIAVGLISGTLSGLMSTMNDNGALTAILALLTLGWSAAIMIPSFSLLVRRLHDLGHSGWAVFVSCIPLVGSLIMFIWMCTDSKGDNQWGPNPKYRVKRNTPAPAPIPTPAPAPAPLPLPICEDPSGPATSPMPIVLPPVESSGSKSGPSAFPLTTAPSGNHSMPDSVAMPKPTAPSFSVTLILCTGPSAGKQFTFQSGQQVTFGRAQPGSHNSILAAYDKVSGTHCRLDVSGSGLMLTDLGSTNGTLVNGKRLTPHAPVPVSHGGVIFLADNNCVFQVKYNQ